MRDRVHSICTQNSFNQLAYQPNITPLAILPIIDGVLMLVLYRGRNI